MKAVYVIVIVNAVLASALLGLRYWGMKDATDRLKNSVAVAGYAFALAAAFLLARHLWEVLQFHRDLREINQDPRYLGMTNLQLFDEGLARTPAGIVGLGMVPEGTKLHLR